MAIYEYKRIDLPKFLVSEDCIDVWAKSLDNVIFHTYIRNKKEMPQILLKRFFIFLLQRLVSQIARSQNI